MYVASGGGVLNNWFLLGSITDTDGWLDWTGWLNGVLYKGCDCGWLKLLNVSNFKSVFIGGDCVGIP